MKTKRSLLQWTGLSIGVVLSIIVAFIPALLYGLLCWHFVHATFGSVLLWFFIGVIALVTELIWGPTVAICWNKTPSNRGDEPPQ